MKESFWRDLYGQTVAQTAHHQRDRALLRGSATENPTYGVLCERRKCGPHHLLHLPEIQSGMENPHPQPIYTSCLTSPHPENLGLPRFSLLESRSLSAERRESETTRNRLRPLASTRKSCLSAKRGCCVL